MIAAFPSHLRLYLIIEEYSFHPPIPMLPAPSTVEHPRPSAAPENEAKGTVCPLTANDQF